MNVANILVDELRTAHERHGWVIGRHVIMPDKKLWAPGLPMR